MSTPPASERQPATVLEETERRERLELKLRELRAEHKGPLHRARGELIDILRRNTYDWDLPGVIGGGEPPEERSPAERGLDQHLELLRRPGAEESGRSLVQTVVRTARWQRAARAPLRVAGMIAGAFFDGVLRLVAMGGRRRG